MVRNNTLSIVHGITPLEVFTGEKPDVSNLRVFGSTCYAHVPVEKRSKLQPVSFKGLFLEYQLGNKAYRIMRESDETIVISRDVIFDERPRSRS